MAKKKPLTSLDFSKLKFDVSDPDIKDVINKFPVFQVHEEFAKYGASDRNKLIKLIIYAFDKGSPFLLKSSRRARMMDCAVHAGYDISKKNILAKIEGIIDGTDTQANNMINCFLTEILNDFDWEYYVSLESYYQELMKNIRTPVDPGLEGDKLEKTYDVRNKNKVSARDTKDELKLLREEMFFSFDDAVEVIKKVEKEKSSFKGGAPETFAK